MRRALAAAIVAALQLTGCSAAGSPWSGPFTPPQGLSRASSWVSGPVATGGIYDIMVRDFRNYSGSPVRVLSVRLVSPHGPGIQVLGARAYPYSRLTLNGTASIDEGDLAKGCPEVFVQHPVTDVVVPPRSNTTWYIVIALVFHIPGRSYHFGVVRVDYLTGGKRGWQYDWLTNARLHTVPKGAIPHLYQPEVCKHA